MELTPLDIHHKEFHRAIRGYSEEEVDVFLDQVADDHERLFNQNRELKEQVEKMKDKVAQYEGLEQTLQKAILTAQRAADEVLANAQKESELIVKDAELKAKEIIQEVASEKQRLERDLQALKDSEKRFRGDFSGLLKSYLEVIASIEKGEHEEVESVVTIEDETEDSEPAVFSPPEAPAPVEERETYGYEDSSTESSDTEIAVEPETEAPAGMEKPGEYGSEPVREVENASTDANAPAEEDKESEAAGEKMEPAAESGDDDSDKKQKSPEEYEDFFNNSSFFGSDAPADADKSSRESDREERKETTDEGSAGKASASPREFEIPNISYDYPERPVSDRGPGDSSNKFSGFFDDSIGDESDQQGGFKP